MAIDDFTELIKMIELYLSQNLGNLNIINLENSNIDAKVLITSVLPHPEEMGLPNSSTTLVLKYKIPNSNIEAFISKGIVFLCSEGTIVVFIELIKIYLDRLLNIKHVNVTTKS